MHKYCENNLFFSDMVVNADRNTVYATAGSNGFIAIEGSNSKIIDEYIFPIDPLSGFNPRTILNNDATKARRMEYFIPNIPGYFLASST
jgi:hypothetical protein